VSWSATACWPWSGRVRQGLACCIEWAQTRPSWRMFVNAAQWLLSLTLFLGLRRIAYTDKSPQLQVAPVQVTCNIAP
jgi:hypothetical protein